MQVCSLREHSLVKPDYFSFLLDCSSESFSHNVSEAIISVFIDSSRHLGDFNHLAFYYVDLINHP